MSRGNDNNRYVQQRSDGDWEVVKERHGRASAIAGTQGQAIDRARDIVRNAGGGELVIKDRQGHIRDSDTVSPGHESPRRDTR
jgi:Uncharacterized protein conserved in bacteria (DUF2188)